MKPLRVLIVEDEAMIAQLYSEVLGSLGYETSAIAGTENEAIASAALDRPDLMLVDMNLNEGSGVEAVRQILAAGFIPYIFVSGETRRERTTDPGAVHLLKPFNEAQLIRAIELAVSRAMPMSEHPGSGSPEPPRQL